MANSFCQFFFLHFSLNAAVCLCLAYVCLFVYLFFMILLFFFFFRSLPIPIKYTKQSVFANFRLFPLRCILEICTILHPVRMVNWNGNSLFKLSSRFLQYFFPFLLCIDHPDNNCECEKAFCKTKWKWHYDRRIQVNRLKQKPNNKNSTENSVIRIWRVKWMWSAALCCWKRVRREVIFRLKVKLFCKGFLQFFFFLSAKDFTVTRNSERELFANGFYAFALSLRISYILQSTFAKSFFCYQFLLFACRSAVTM